MKTKLLNLTGLRSLLLLACMMLGMSAWGEKVTFTYSDYQGKGTQSSGSEYTMEKTDVSIKSTKFYGNTSNAHFYANGEIAIKPVNGVTITQVELTATGTSYNGYQSNGTISATVGTLSHSGATVTWSGAASSEFTLKNDKQIRWTSIVVTYTPSGSTPPCAIPTFDPAEGNYSQAQKVTISCSTENSTIYYTLDGNDPTTSSSVYSSPITISKTTTVKAIATASGFENSSVASATYTITTPLTIAAAREQGTGDVFTKGIVTSCVGTTGYIQDATAAICVYGKSLTVGDEITVFGTLSTYKGLLEITNPVVTVLSSGNSIAPEVMTIAEVNASTKQGWLVTIEEATVTEVDGRNTTIAQGENTIVVRDISSDVTYGVNDQLTLTGNIGCFETAQIVNPTNISVISNQPPVIKAEDVTLAYDDTYGKIEYTIVNPVNGVALTATSTATWISNITVVDGAVTFDATENEGTEDRTATFTLSYTGAEDVTVTVTQKHFVADYATLPFEFDGGKADIENTAGLTHSGLGGDYSSSPKLKFDGTGDYLILHFNERPGTLTFTIKGNGFSEGTFTVQTSEDGESYTDLETYTVLDAASNEEFEGLGENVRYIKWVYTEKMNGNVALGNINVTKYGYTQTYTVNWTAGENTELFVFAGDESETIENGASIAPGTTVMVSVDVAEGYTLGSLSVKDADGEDVELTEIEANVYYSFEMPASNVTITSSAVEPITGDKYVKVTSTEDLEDGQYLIVYEDGNVAFDGGLETLDAVGNTISVNIVKNEIAANETTNAAAFTIDVTNGTIKSASGLYIGVSSNTNGLKQSEDAETFTNSFSIDSEGNAVISAVFDQSTMALRYNKTSGQTRFRYFKNAGQEAIQLYKKVIEAPILLGDVNGDEEVTIADVVAIINYLLDPTSVKFNEAAADFDGQNGVTLADALAIINKIIGKQ